MKSKKPDFNFKDLSELPADERKEVQRWITRLSAVQKPIQKSLADIARYLGCSVGTVRRKYDLWQRYEDWRDLVNYAHLPKSDDDRIRFIEWWRALCIVHGRKCASAHRDFVRLVSILANGFLESARIFPETDYLKVAVTLL